MSLAIFRNACRWFARSFPALHPDDRDFTGLLEPRGIRVQCLAEKYIAWG